MMPGVYFLWNSPPDSRDGSFYWHSIMINKQWVYFTWFLFSFACVRGTRMQKCFVCHKPRIVETGRRPAADDTRVCAVNRVTLCLHSGSFILPKPPFLFLKTSRRPGIAFRQNRYRCLLAAAPLYKYRSILLTYLWLCNCCVHIPAYPNGYK
jgi:hypothetical protein